ncbi:MAG: hypothetical protein Fur002_26580 [Anaerolineales bacterium]
MFNNIKHIFVGVLSAVIVIAIGASAYNAFASGGVNVSTPASSVNYGQGNGSENGNGQGQNGAGGIPLTVIPASDVNAQESAGLLYMREEEKLARDVYNQLFALWTQPTFQNIAASEQTHMDEIKLLLDRYGLADPALAPGKFTDQNLQALYNQLIAQGSVSLEEAMKVGILVEQTDIADLQTRLAQSDNADIQQVYNNLMAGSYNHLAAFSGEQGQRGQGQGANGSGIPQANISGATTVHGAINSFDGFEISLTLDDGQLLYVQLGNANYAQSIGFTPQTGEGVTVSGFVDDQNSYSAITVTLDSTKQTFTFRDANGRPAWAGGNGKGKNH